VGACLATLLYFVSHRLWVGAAVSAVGVIAALAAAVMLRARLTGDACPPIGLLGGPYGNGPYRRADVAPNERIVDDLAQVAEKLRTLPEREPGNWPIDWHAFDAERASAHAAAKRGDYAAAVRDYCRSIHKIMQQLREHRPTIDPDDAI
jgi:hypothetical protein